jgi:hypothetical protein
MVEPSESSVGEEDCDDSESESGVEVCCGESTKLRSEAALGCGAGSCRIGATAA